MLLADFAFPHANTVQLLYDLCKCYAVSNYTFRDAAGIWRCVKLFNQLAKPADGRFCL